MTNEKYQMTMENVFGRERRACPRSYLERAVIRLHRSACLLGRLFAGGS